MPMGNKKLKTLFTEEMAVSILTRLPVKSAIRFSFMSKFWRSRIISNPQFAKAHFKLATDQKTLRHRLLVSTSMTPRVESLDLETSSFGEDSSVRRLTAPFHETGYSVRLLGSCNGLVLIALDTCKRLSIWNPTTGFLHYLPPPCLSSEGDYRFCCHGFGYVSATKDYKVIISYHVHDGAEFVDEFSAFSLRSNSWKRIGDRRPSYLNIYETGGVLSNETLHWLDKEWDQGQVILALDLTNEEFKELPVPNFNEEDYWTHIGASLGGCLCVAADDHCQGEDGGEDPEIIQVCVMKKYGVRESWTKLFKYKVNHWHNLYHHDSFGLFSVKPILYTESGKVIVMIFYGNGLIRIEKDNENMVESSRQYRPEERLRFGVLYEETLISLIDY